MEQQIYYWFQTRCEHCGYIESHPSAKREKMKWIEFKLMLLSSPEAGENFRYCDNCKKYSRQTLISFDAE